MRSRVTLLELLEWHAQQAQSCSRNAVSNHKDSEKRKHYFEQYGFHVLACEELARAVAKRSDSTGEKDSNKTAEEPKKAEE